MLKVLKKVCAVSAAHTFLDKTLIFKANVVHIKHRI